MMPTPPLSTLYPTATKAEYLDLLLDIATKAGLVTTSWEEGDVTLTEYDALAEMVASKDAIGQNYVASGFLDLIAGLARNGSSGAYQWLVLLAEQVYGYEARESGYATTYVTFSNGGGGLYQDLVAGDVTLRASSTGKTYQITNETPFTIPSGPGVVVENIPVTADEPGSDSSAAAGEIDEVVTGLLGVTVTNPTAAIGTDAESVDSIVQGCRDSLGLVSAVDGPPDDAYDALARNSELTGTTAVTRSRTWGDSATGDVLQRIAGPSGSVPAEVVSAVEAAAVRYIVPLALATYTVESAIDQVQAVAYRLYLYDTAGLTEGEAATLVENGLLEHFRRRPIGGDTIAGDSSGRIYRSAIIGAIKALFKDRDFVKVDLAIPAIDTPVPANCVPVLGLVTPYQISFEKAPSL